MSREPQSDQARIGRLIPLKPIWLQVLTAIAAGQGHGYAIRKAVEADTGGAVRLWPATLYGTLRQLEEADLVREREMTDDPRRKRTFELTGFGERVLAAEGTRLARLVDAIRRTVPVE